mmetsp:Transcript_10923/g.16804  ORF Transcript_10923/g.16804 Transcript_10923/m.16804 type:complete len:393 (-) Transcript_10923:43-1221(-)
MTAISFAIVLLCLILLMTLPTTTSGQEDYVDLQQQKLLVAQFDSWSNRNNKAYPSTTEYNQRFSIYASNHALVNLHNTAYEKGLTSYAMTMDGPFADLTFDEFEASYLMKKKKAKDCYATTHSKEEESVPVDLTIPKARDWRTKGILTPIKSQGRCGSCWTFATTGTLEAHHCLAHGLDNCSEWKGLSEQQLVDCAGGSFGNEGCSGGWPSTAMEYVEYAGGIVTETSYRYLGRNGTACHAAQKLKHPHNIGARIRKVHNITVGDEHALVRAVGTKGPVAVAFDVAHGFSLYSHGVYDAYNATSGQHDLCQKDLAHLNHAVVAVGYGETMEDDPKPYHIVRNSWGNTWGMEGYFWILRGENLCGISDCAAYPDLISTTSTNNVIPFLRKSTY